MAFLPVFDTNERASSNRSVTAIFLPFSNLDPEEISVKETVTKVINGVERRFAVLELNHFSCYAIAVTKAADAD